MLKSQVDGIDVLDDLSVLLNGQVYHTVVNSIFLQLNKCAM